MSASIRIKAAAAADLTPQLRDKYLRQLCKLRGLREPVTFSHYGRDALMVSLRPDEAPQPHNLWSSWQVWVDLTTGDFSYDGDYQALREFINGFSPQLGDLHQLTTDVIDPLLRAGVAHEVVLQADGALSVTVETPDEDRIREVVL